MKTMNDNFGGNDYPPMRLPKQENATSSFEEKCNGLEELVSRCYDFFMWYAEQPKCRRYELYSTVFLECLFLQMLSYMHETDNMRGRVLLDESLELFLKLLKMLNARMRTGHFLIRSSNEILVDEIKNNASHFVETRRETIEGFREHEEWLKAFCRDERKKAQVYALADRLQLNYPMKMFACMGDDFDQHANMAFNALMKLALPSMANYSEEEFAQVFQNSVNTFKKGSSWKAIEAQLEEDIEHNLKDANCDSYSAKMARVKELWWKPTRLAIRVLLGKFGITYVNVLSGSNMSQIGRQIYERLNGIRIDKNDDSPLERMTNDDLCRYLKLESELQFFANKIEEFRIQEEKEHEKTDEQPATETETVRAKTPSKKTFMKHEADERKLPSIMRDANKQHLNNQHTLVEGSVAWKDYHVAVCLLFYLCDSNNADGALFSGLGRAFYKSFDKKEFPTMCSYERFNDMQKKLRDEGFKKVIACKSASEFDDKKIGHGTMKMWYEFYHRLLPIFKLHLPERDPAQEKNGFIKLT